MLTTKISQKSGILERTPIKPILKIFRAENKRPYHPLNMNKDDISHFSTIPASFAIKSNVYFITHQYSIINNSQSQGALSVYVRTVLWIYFASRRNCGLLPTVAPPRGHVLLSISTVCSFTVVVILLHAFYELKHTSYL